MSVESHDLGPVPNLTALSGYGDSYVVPGDEVYVITEDTDYIYRNTGTNPVADGFNIIKAIFLPGFLPNGSLLCAAFRGHSGRR